ncbi:metallophosphoesterase [Maridesulfovibrio ferrireducens]|uniref:metallophosphoesterase n=1 Tax=Maridesulfovibrio ferrireducens TaxID=246191 RepID=UPI001A2B1765|nr:metallophosphoesterase [Maridesulfovibrio ferrireducens]MBI9113066.1 metallophosphoesterase [Maridesulfovibrio ferrireducens]
MNALSQNIFPELAARMGKEALSRRLILQVEHSATLYGKGNGHVHLENLEGFTRFVGSVLKLSGMAERGKRNSLKFRTEKNTIELPELPSSFNGFKILHLSDIHIDGFTDNGAALISLVKSLKYDLCVLTGDYRFLTHNTYEKSSIGMERLIENIHCPQGIYAILGNHDFIEQVPALEKAGAKVLLNEHTLIEKKGEQLFLAGVDDPHFYGSHDLERALQSRHNKTTTILLSHSPELFAEAAQSDVDLYLCGHTHGGQICLPGEIPLITHAACPRRITAGRWEYGKMIGYTSRGAGCSGVTARFNCPPEATIHTLRKANSEDSTGDGA